MWQPDTSDLQLYQFEPKRTAGSSRKRPKIEHESSSDDEERSESDRSRLDSSEWCSCGRCMVMPTNRENVCCQEVQNVKKNLSNIKCICEHCNFDPVCLNRDVLRTGLVARSQILRNDLVEPLSNE